ncbi:MULTISPECIES: DUF7575 domain-containing protein [unclassified Blautia]|uniref:DUF7575 domain-containing protein n=1 Tax=unclassified Blautia TaxID=2648079 RepID=UPI003F8AE002
MAAEIIDGLVKTLSKTTKEIGKATKELGARAEQGIEAQKIRNKIAGEERIIEKIKVDIGDVIYRRHSQGDGIDSELSALCQEIDQHYLKVREYKDSAANIKGQKICPSCEREVDINVSFCPYCGTPCPTPEPAKDVEGDTVSSEEDSEDGSCGTEKAQAEEVQPEEPKTEESAEAGSAQEQPVEESTVEEETVEEPEAEKVTEEDTDK